MMNSLKLKRLIIPGIYLLAVCLIIGSICWIVFAVDKYLTIPKDYNYSINGVFEKELIPVVTNNTTIIRPYLSEEVTIGKYFYDFESDSTNQEKALIFYENTYMQNSGVDYVSNKIFDVVAILDGEIIKVETDKILGNIVEIKHEGDIVSVYQGIDNVSLSVGNTINQGEIIGISGVSKINTEYTTALHFEVYYKGKLLDPENFYSLNLGDL